MSKYFIGHVGRRPMWKACLKSVDPVFANNTQEIVRRLKGYGNFNTIVKKIDGVLLADVIKSCDPEVSQTLLYLGYVQFYDNINTRGGCHVVAAHSEEVFARHANFSNVLWRELLYFRPQWVKYAPIDRLNLFSHEDWEYLLFNSRDHSNLIDYCNDYRDLDWNKIVWGDHNEIDI